MERLDKLMIKKIPSLIDTVEFLRFNNFDIGSCEDEVLKDVIEILHQILREKEIIKYMEEKKYQVTWEKEIIARDMRLDDALIFIKALCEKYDNNRINISLLDEKVTTAINK